MKTTIFLALSFTATAALGAPPVKAPDSQYTHLHTNSPFTSKPPPPERAAEIDTFEDWALGGVSEISDGYMVTLLHKKNAGETMIIRPSGTMVSKKDEITMLEPGAAGSFKIERVEYGKESWKDTVVVLAGGSRTGQVKFDDKLSVPKSTAPPPQQGRQPGQLPGQPNAQNPGNPGQQQGGRQPRQRVLPPNPQNPQQQQQQLQQLQQQLQQQQQNQNQGRRGGR